MLGFLGHYYYKNKVLSNVYALLFYYPRGIEKILENHVWVISSIESGYTHRIRPQHTALYITNDVIRELILPLDREQRREIHEILHNKTLDRLKNELKNITRSQTDEMSFGIDYAAIMLGGAIVRADAMFENRKISAEDFDAFCVKINKALFDQK